MLCCVCVQVSARERVLDFICTVCGRGFQDVQSALAHIKTTNHKYNAKVRSYVCARLRSMYVF